MTPLHLCSCLRTMQGYNSTYSWTTTTLAEKDLAMATGSDREEQGAEVGHLVLAAHSERTERRATCRNEMYHSRGKEVADLWDPLMGRTPSLTVNLELRGQEEEEANLERPREQRAKTVEHSVSAR